MNKVKRASVKRSLDVATPDKRTQLKKVGGIVALLEQAREEARESQMEDIEMIVSSALNLVFSTYYLHIRGEYLEKE